MKFFLKEYLLKPMISAVVFTITVAFLVYAANEVNNVSSSTSINNGDKIGSAWFQEINNKVSEISNNISGDNLINLNDPINSKDAATKNYVDNSTLSRLEILSNHSPIDKTIFPEYIVCTSDTNEELIYHIDSYSAHDNPIITYVNTYGGNNQNIQFNTGGNYINSANVGSSQGSDCLTGITNISDSRKYWP